MYRTAHTAIEGLNFISFMPESNYDYSPEVTMAWNQAKSKEWGWS